MELEPTPRTALLTEANDDRPPTTEEVHQICATLLEALPGDDDDDDDSTASTTSDILLAADPDEDLVSTASQSRVSATSATQLASTGTIRNRADATLSRAFMTYVRGHQDGGSLPTFTLVPINCALPASPRDHERLSLMVAGQVDGPELQVAWHEICSGTSLLPGVEVDFAQPTQCCFCTVHTSLATPVVQLKHLCTFGGTEQRIQVGVRPACAPCARKRTSALRSSPVITVSHVFLQERLTAHLTYVVCRMRDLFDSITLQQDDDAVACDACYKPRSHEDDCLVVVARRRDNSSLAVFTVCSDECHDQLQQNLRSMTHESVLRPRAVNPTDMLSGELTTFSTANPPQSLRVPDADEVPVAQWEVLEDEDFRALARDGPNGISVGRAGTGTVVHHCKKRGCFCRATHRGAFRTDLLKKKKEKELGTSAAEPVVEHYVLERVFNQLRTVYLYTDILGSDGQTRCLACKKPTTSFCTECRAVRSCPNDECRRKSNSTHAKLCRPYSDTWSAFTIA